MSLFRWLAFLPTPASTVAGNVDRLHAFVLTTTMLGTFAVFLFTAWMLARFQVPLERARGALAPRVRTPIWVDVVVIVGLLGLFLGWWVIGFRDYVRMRSPPPDAIPVYVTAKQWMWEFTYPDGTRSQDVLVVPIGQAVRLALASRDVIHSFFVPAFRVKQDAVPGRTNITWFQASRVGTYPLLCAEYCGLSHSRMRAEVRVVDAVDWARWAEQNRAAPQAGGPGSTQTLADRGRAVAVEKGCLACHTVDGASATGPTWRALWYARVPLEGGQEVVADEAYLTRAMMEPQVEVVRGYAPVMPSFRGRLDAPETAAILEFIRSLEGP